MRTWPTVLAVLAFVPLAVLLWWALAGPRPAPAALDWDSLGYRVTEEMARGGDGARFDGAVDVALATRAMEGHQRPLLGALEEARLHGDGGLVAIVREAGEPSRLAESPDVAGLVVRNPDGDHTRCALDEPIPVTVLDEVAERLGSEVHAARGEVTGRCRDGRAELAVPLVRRVVVPIEPLQRLAGQRAESTFVPAGVLRVAPDGEVAVEQQAGDGPVPVYPGEVARAALLRAAPGNPNAHIGTLGDPAYPVLARSGDALWWVMPVSPDGDGEAVSGFASTPADRTRAGTINPVTLRWLAEPVPGPVLLERRALSILEEAGELDAGSREQWRVWFGVPDADGAWHGRVARAGGVRFRLGADAGGTVCVDDLDGRRVGCLGPDS